MWENKGGNVDMMGNGLKELRGIIKEHAHFRDLKKIVVDTYGRVEENMDIHHGDRKWLVNFYKGKAKEEAELAQMEGRLEVMELVYSSVERQEQEEKEFDERLEEFLDRYKY